MTKTKTERGSVDLTAEIDEAVRRRLDPPPPTYRTCEFCGSDEPAEGGQDLDGRWLGPRCKATYHEPGYSASEVLDSIFTAAMRGHRRGSRRGSVSAWGSEGVAARLGYEGGPVDPDQYASAWDTTVGRLRRAPTPAERQAAEAEAAARDLDRRTDALRRGLARADRDIADAQARRARIVADLQALGLDPDDL